MENWKSIGLAAIIQNMILQRKTIPISLSCLLLVGLVFSLPTQVRAEVNSECHVQFVPQDEVLDYLAYYIEKGRRVFNGHEQGVNAKRLSRDILILTKRAESILSISSPKWEQIDEARHLVQLLEEIQVPQKSVSHQKNERARKLFERKSLKDQKFAFDLSEIGSDEFGEIEIIDLIEHTHRDGSGEKVQLYGLALQVRYRGNQFDIERKTTIAGMTVGRSERVMLNHLPVGPEFEALGSALLDENISQSVLNDLFDQALESKERDVHKDMYDVYEDLQDGVEEYLDRVVPEDSENWKTASITILSTTSQIQLGEKGVIDLRRLLVFPERLQEQILDLLEAIYFHNLGFRD